MKTVGIVGGGFSGMLTAYHLLHNSEKPLEVVLFNHSYPTGQGVAYSSKEEEHLLNVPAGKMSALPEDPDHFVNWLCSSYSENDWKDKFVPRKKYGEYLKDLFLSLHKDTRNKFSVIEKTVKDIERKEETFVISTSDTSHHVCSVVLATGNLLPSPIIEGVSDNYIEDPWKFDQLEKKIRTAENIFIVGTGLSMVDIILYLEKIKCTKKIFCISSNGLLPKRHLDGPVYPDYLTELNDCKDINEIYSIVKKHLKNSLSFGYTMQSVVDVLRPYVQQIWLKLDEPSRQRFMRHLKHGWNVLRHRIPSSTADVVERFQRDGLLEIFPGKIHTITESSSGLDISVRIKRNGIKQFRSCLLINCTGPLMNYHKINDPLYVNLFKRKLAYPGSLGLGLNALATGELLDDEQKVIKDVYTLGPALKSVLWETTAVGEIRNQAKRIAKEILIDKGLIA